MKSSGRLGLALNEFANNPFSKTTPASFCGIAFILGFYGRVLTILVLLSLFTIVGFIILSRNRRVWIIFALFGIAGALFGYVSSPAGRVVKLARYWDCHGVIVDGEILPFADRRFDKVVFPVLVHRVFLNGRGEEIGEKILLSIRRTGKEWLPGDRFFAQLKIRRPENFGNPGSFDYVAYLARRGIYGRAFLESDLFLVPALERHNFFSFCRIIFRTSERLRRRFSQWLEKKVRQECNNPDDVNGFLQALLLGYRGFFTSSLAEDIASSGVSHLVVISGLHFATVAFFCYFLIRWFIRLCCPDILVSIPDRIVVVLLTIPILGFYALLTGLSPPSFRAFIFVLLPASLLFFYRPYNSMTLLIAAAVTIILTSPSQAFSLSFLLSFTAVAVIFAVLLPFGMSTRDVHNFFQRLKLWTYNFLWLNFCVQIGLFPLCLYLFHRFSLMSLVGNALLVPLVAFVVLPAGLLIMTLWFFWEKGAGLIFHWYGWVVSIILKILAFLGSFPSANIWSGKFSFLPVILYWAVLLSMVRFFRKGNLFIRWGILTLLPVVFWAGLQLDTISKDHSDFVTVVIDVSQGNSTFMRFPNGHTMLVDGGGFRTGNFDIGRYVIHPFLAEMEVTRLNTVVLSHYHADHAKGLVFFARSFPVDSFWDAPCIARENGVPDINGMFRRRGVYVPPYGEVFGAHHYGDVAVRVIHPNPGDLPRICTDVNRSSTVLVVRYGKTVLVIPSDVDAQVMQTLDFGVKDGDRIVLIAPHHGSKYSFLPDVFRKLDPCMVVASCRSYGKVRLPYQGLVKWCSEYGVLLARTDKDGAIFLKSNGKEWMYRTYGKKLHWTTNQCGTVFSETFKEIPTSWKPVCRKH